ncbi:J domain-containing protein 1 [Vermiconidia calcicola]|uniref:J domain-containing protein 1 n=1 Tax=Vermiconidia calcicola TaxID=1690605 RepID=A0ACC3NPP2_9PEZI|nr:J domain-containing protein 1 [Vermiconidia calcicola]
MIIRKPNILLAAYSTFNSFPTTIAGSSTSLKKRKRESIRPCTYCRYQNKGYATIAGNSGDHHGRQEHEHHPWPKAPNGSPCPTPYQIFEMKANAAYSKARFYKLVKVYHPDRKTGANERMSPALRNERYRLIVTANDILSDPTKRSAYDRFGAGWDGKAELGSRDTWYQPSPHHRPGPFSQNWDNPRDPIWQNATWEDWERFYRKRAQAEGMAAGVNQPNRTGLYLSNSYFLLVVMVCALIGSTANYSRAQNEGHYFVEQRDIIHDKASKELRRVKQEASSNRSREDQIQWFLRNREANMGLPGSDPGTLREEKIDRMLPEREVCRSEEVVETD